MLLRFLFVLSHETYLGIGLTCSQVYGANLTKVYEFQLTIRHTYAIFVKVGMQVFDMHTYLNLYTMPQSSSLQCV
jgi:hypothetical protein